MYDLIIIGAGPAGLAAGLYAGRYRLNAFILEKMVAGGQIILSSTIDNYPGFPNGIATHELIDKFKAQVDEVGVKILSDEVIGVSSSFKLRTPVYNIKTKDNNNYETKSIIIASGAYPKKLGISGEDKFVGRGVSYCGTCDGPLFKVKDIAVIGGGDRAVEEAIFLSKYASKVFLVHRRDQLRASKILEEKAKQEPKINFVLGSVVDEIIGKDSVEAIRVKNLKTGSLSNLPCRGVFIFVGIQPNTVFLKGLLEMDEQGFIVTEADLKASKEGIFACGDCRRKTLYQVVNACGEGAVAADSAHKYILSQG